jgi:hypothetical protein
LGKEKVTGVGVTESVVPMPLSTSRVSSVAISLLHGAHHR